MDTGDSPAELPGQPSNTVTQEPQTTTAPSQQQDQPASDAPTNQQTASDQPSNQQQANQPDDGPTVWNNVDPQFLIAVPQDVRAEIIRDTLNRNAESGSGQANVLSTRLNPEFLNALPQNIQQEVIDQQRRHEEQRAAFNQATQPSADNSSFIHQLEPDLRRQLLGEMEDSEIAQLPQALQEEARSLRAENERRQMEQHRNVTEHLQRGGMLVDFGVAGGRRRALRYHQGSQGAQAGNGDKTFQSRQVLDHESLSHLLLLLFVQEDSKLNVQVLHKVFRNVCYHSATRDWLVSTLVSILQRSGDTKVAKQPAKKQEATTVKYATSSWMSIKLDGALGARASIFQVAKVPSQSSNKKSSSQRLVKKLFIHPQAAPLVARHAIDCLNMLSKVFPADFVQPQQLVASTNKKSKELNDAEVSSDFWDILMKLDTSSSTKKKITATSRAHTATIDQENRPTTGPVVIKDAGQLQTSWLSFLLKQLSHPVVKKNQQLTDRMLKLLSNISKNIKAPPKSTLARTVTPPQATTPPSEEVSTSQQQPPVATQPAPAPQQPPVRTMTTRTMSAQASTSNTQTDTRGNTATETSTTTSSKSLISSSHQGENTPKKEECLKDELGVCIEVLTSHSCSEDGLEDATQLLLQLSKSADPLRSVIVSLLVDGGKTLGVRLAEQISGLYREIKEYNKNKKSNVDSPSTSSNQGEFTSRFDKDKKLVLKKDDKLARDLQLPSMQPLTCKTSRQAFFLRILKVILQLQTSGKHQYFNFVPNSNQVRSQIRRWRRQHPNTQFGLFDGDSLLDMDALNAAYPLPSWVTRHQQRSQGSSRGGSSSRNNEASTSGQGATTESKPEETQATLAEKLQLESLWKVLGDCLKELEKSGDEHAVLVLQPAVEAFFLVHSFDIKQDQPDQEDASTSRNENEEVMKRLTRDDFEHFFEDLDAKKSESSLIDDKMPKNEKEFLKFADRHRTVLNQILRQSTVPLATGPFSVLATHTRVLDFDVKRKHFRQQLDKLSETSGSRSRDDLQLKVSRKNLFEDSFREFQKKSGADLRARLYVTFKDEDGQDAGGVLREWYQVISEQIFNQNYCLFMYKGHGCYAINPTSTINPAHLQYFEFVGRVVAKAIFDNKHMSCYFCRSFYKHILGKQVTSHDYESEEPGSYRHLLSMLDQSLKQIGVENCLTFSVDESEFGMAVNKELKPGGNEIEVTEENKKHYVYLYCKHKMCVNIKDQINAFLKGFYQVIPFKLISMFDEQELELLISGLPTIDVADMKANTTYTRFTTASKQVQWFWRALKSFDEATKAKFLQFATGTSKVPIGGFSRLEGMTGVQLFQISMDNRSTDRLPCAHTCFNQLDLPLYETYDKLREKLLQAINECTVGFGLA